MKTKFIVYEVLGTILRINPVREEKISLALCGGLDSVETFLKSYLKLCNEAEIERLRIRLEEIKGKEESFYFIMYNDIFSQIHLHIREII